MHTCATATARLVTSELTPLAHLLSKCAANIGSIRQKAKRLCLHRQLTTLSNNQRASRASILSCVTCRTLVYDQGRERIAMFAHVILLLPVGHIWKMDRLIETKFAWHWPSRHLCISTLDPYDSMQAHSMQHTLRGHNMMTFGCACACRPRCRSR